MCRTLRFILPTLLLVSATCQFSENRYAKNPVTEKQLVGTWIATDFGIKSLRDIGVRTHLQKSDHVLVLRSDGSCSFKTFLRPDRAFGGGDPEYRTYESGCTWKLGEVGHQSLNLTLPASSRANPYYYFDDEGGKLLIWQYAEDPDQWRYIEFQKSLPEFKFEPQHRR